MVTTPLAIVPVPSVVAPLVKVTVPVALLGSVAVRVTDWPIVDGLSDDESVAVGVAFPTT
jgi:hypothetical protein